jgi:hypothetical protein
VSVIACLATLAMSASGFVLSKTLMFPSFEVALMADLLSQTCCIEGGEKPYTLRMRLMILKVAMLPYISARYELTSSMRPSVAQKP